ncbi:MAG TPA: serine hydrolase domain-containing protein, partial [Xanthomonadales bacterium]|nr:serine hydrolase domain-containing protein [Xanthomonadales bacterium]
PLAKHLDGLPQAWRPLTLRQLLTHTSGLKDWEAAGLLDFRREYTDAEFDALMAPYALDFAPGTRWGYSNTGYILLGRVVAKVAAMPYDEFVRTRIFARLGMDATRFSRPQEIVPHRAGGYVDGAEGLRKGMLLRPRIVEPNGGILATANELAKWSRSFRPGALMREECLAAMTSPVQLADGGTFPSGLGLFASSFRGHRTWVNNGTTPGGYSAVYYVYPDDALAVHVLCNIDRGDAINRIATRVASFQVHGLDVRSLATVDDHAPRETKALFAALRAHAAGRSDSRVAGSLRLSEDARKRMAAQLARDARIVRLEPDPGAAATLRYRVENAGQRWWYTLVLDDEGRIADLEFEGE